MLIYEKLAYYLADAVNNLINIDSALFTCEAHETCINHRLAIYLERTLSKQWNSCDEALFVDIEFNRTLVNDNHRKMQLTIDQSLTFGDQEVSPKLIRPDIVIHNRKDNHGNVLWIEVKIGSDPYICQADVNKIFHACQQFSFQLGASLLIDYPENKLWIWIVDPSGQIEEYEFHYENGNISSCYVPWKPDMKTYPLLIAIDEYGNHSCKF